MLFPGISKELYKTLENYTIFSKGLNIICINLSFLVSSVQVIVAVTFLIVGSFCELAIAQKMSEGTVPFFNLWRPVSVFTKCELLKCVEQTQVLSVTCWKEG